MRWLAIFVTIFLSVADGSDDGLCARQLEHFTQSLRRRDSWALELFDTWTKLQSGLASRNAVDFGHFDQCVDFMHAASSRSDVGTIRGQYCLVYYRATRNSTHDENDADFQWTDIGSFVRDKNLRLGAGFCLPASCSVQQVQAFVDSYLSRADLAITADYDQSLYCRTSDSPPLETVDIVAM